MQLTKENVIKILSQNFGFPVVRNPVVGEVVQLDAQSAYFYSAVTGHAYLNNPILGFSPNGLIYIFNQANAYNLITGMFDRDGSFRNTPLLHTQLYPFIQTSPKYILPVEYQSSYRALQDKLTTISEQLTREGFNPTDFLICRIDLKTKGYHMEAFCEYVVSEYFNRQGYLTETQIPFFYSGGTPDLAAYEIPTVINVLRKYGVIFNGSSFIKIASIRAFEMQKSQHDESQQASKVEALVGEAKTSTLDASTQMKKYLSFGVFNKAYEIIPHKTTPEVISGLISFDEEGYIQVQEAKQPVMVNQKKQQEYLAWLKNYIKYFLVVNLSNDEFDDFYGQVTGRGSRTLSQLIEFVNQLEYEQILAYLNQRL